MTPNQKKALDALRDPASRQAFLKLARRDGSCSALAHVARALGVRIRFRSTSGVIRALSRKLGMPEYLIEHMAELNDLDQIPLAEIADWLEAAFK